MDQLISSAEVSSVQSCLAFHLLSEYKAFQLVGAVHRYCKNEIVVIILCRLRGF